MNLRKHSRLIKLAIAFSALAACSLTKAADERAEQNEAVAAAADLIGKFITTKPSRMPVKAFVTAVLGNASCSGIDHLLAYPWRDQDVVCNGMLGKQQRFRARLSLRLGDKQEPAVVVGYRIVISLVGPSRVSLSSLYSAIPNGERPFVDDGPIPYRDRCSSSEIFQTGSNPLHVTLESTVSRSVCTGKLGSLTFQY